MHGLTREYGRTAVMSRTTGEPTSTVTALDNPPEKWPKKLKNGQKPEKRTKPLKK
jgi:hypothetical protein